MVYDILLRLLPTHRESLLSMDPCKQAVEEPYLGITLDCEKKEHCGSLTLNSLVFYFFFQWTINLIQQMWEAPKETGSLERLGADQHISVFQESLGWSRKPWVSHLSPPPLICLVLLWMSETSTVLRVFITQKSSQSCQDSYCSGVVALFSENLLLSLQCS